jgi:hypothetical protein
MSQPYYLLLYVGMNNMNLESNSDILHEWDLHGVMGALVAPI